MDFSEFICQIFHAENSNHKEAFECMQAPSHPTLTIDVHQLTPSHSHTLTSPPFHSLFKLDHQGHSMPSMQSMGTVTAGWTAKSKRWRSHSQIFGLKIAPNSCTSSKNCDPYIVSSIKPYLCLWPWIFTIGLAVESMENKLQNELRGCGWIIWIHGES